MRGGQRCVSARLSTRASGNALVCVLETGNRGKERAKGFGEKWYAGGTLLYLAERSVL